MSGGNWIAIVAVVASMLTVALSAYATQRLAREERRQARLAETYVTLMDYANRAIQYGSVATPPKKDPGKLPVSEEPWLNLGVRVLAFASDEMRGLFDQFAELWRLAWNQQVLRKEVWDGTETGSKTPEELQEQNRLLGELNSRKQALVQHAEAVIRQARHELGSQSRFRSQWWRLRA